MATKKTPLTVVEGEASPPPAVRPGFTAEQIEMLGAKLDASHVKERSQAGQTLSYIESWLTIAEANRIFGYDGWDREVLVLEPVGPSYVTQDKRGQDQHRVAYRCTTRITVYAGDRVIKRDGSGYGSGLGKDLNDAHESALKEATSDAMKRAFMTFGNPFGLALYDKDGKNVITAEEKAFDDIRKAMKTRLSEVKDVAELEALKDELRPLIPAAMQFDRGIKAELITGFAARQAELETPAEQPKAEATPAPKAPKAVPAPAQKSSAPPVDEDATLHQIIDALPAETIQEPEQLAEDFDLPAELVIVPDGNPPNWTVFFKQCIAAIGQINDEVTLEKWGQVHNRDLTMLGSLTVAAHRKGPNGEKQPVSGKDFADRIVAAVNDRRKSLGGQITLYWADGHVRNFDGLDGVMQVLRTFLTETHVQHIAPNHALINRLIAEGAPEAEELKGMLSIEAELLEKKRKALER